MLLQISETSTLYWLQSAQVSWLGLCHKRGRGAAKAHFRDYIPECL